MIVSADDCHKDNDDDSVCTNGYEKNDDASTDPTTTRLDDCCDFDECDLRNAFDVLDTMGEGVIALADLKLLYLAVMVDIDDHIDNHGNVHSPPQYFCDSSNKNHINNKNKKKKKHPDRNHNANNEVNEDDWDVVSEYLSALVSRFQSPLQTQSQSQPPQSRSYVTLATTLKIMAHERSVSTLQRQRQETPIQQILPNRKRSRLIHNFQHPKRTLQQHDRKENHGSFWSASFQSIDRGHKGYLDAQDLDAFARAVHHDNDHDHPYDNSWTRRNGGNGCISRVQTQEMLVYFADCCNKKKKKKKKEEDENENADSTEYRVPPTLTFQDFIRIFHG